MSLKLAVINDLLIKQGRKKSEFASSIGMSRQNLDRIIKDNSTKPETLARIAKALNAPISIFYEDTDIATESNTNYGNAVDISELQKENAFLKQQLKEKTEYLDILKEKIKNLEKK